ncbi:hypothetical protein [Paenibacillus hemerocallicola]|nr:hypothetical protein [Paenibacillus hemerocallicola]
MRLVAVMVDREAAKDGYIRPELTEEAAMLYFTMYNNELGRLVGVLRS